MLIKFPIFAAVCLGFMLLTSCSNQVEAEHPVVFRFERGKTAWLGPDGYASAPRRAPKEVKLAIAAGNRLQASPYRYGGGHARENDSGYDCSGATSYVLREAGLLRSSLTSGGFFEYGDKGYGRWISLYMRKGHVYMTVAGLRLDTGGTWNSTGPRWKPEKRNNPKGTVVRHPRGL